MKIHRMIKIQNPDADFMCSFCGANFTPLFTTDTGNIYICPNCVREANKDMGLPQPPEGEEDD